MNKTHNIFLLLEAYFLFFGHEKFSCQIFLGDSCQKFGFFLVGFGLWVEILKGSLSKRRNCMEIKEDDHEDVKGF